MEYEILEESIRSLPDNAIADVKQYIESICMMYKTKRSPAIDANNLEVGFGMWKDRDISEQSIRNSAWQGNGV